MIEKHIPVKNKGVLKQNEIFYLYILYIFLYFYLSKNVIFGTILLCVQTAWNTYNLSLFPFTLIWVLLCTFWNVTVREIYSQLHEGEDKGAYIHNLWRFSKDSFAVYLYVCKSFRSSEVLQIARIRKKLYFCKYVHVGRKL